jgi:hypothetical protein
MMIQIVSDYGCDPRINLYEFDAAVSPASIQVLESPELGFSDAVKVFCHTVGLHCHVIREMLNLADMGDNLNLISLHNTAKYYADRLDDHYYGLPRTADYVGETRILWLTSSAVELSQKDNGSWVVTLTRGAEWRQDKFYYGCWLVAGGEPATTESRLDEYPYEGEAYVPPSY